MVQKLKVNKDFDRSNIQNINLPRKLETKYKARNQQNIKIEYFNASVIANVQLNKKKKKKKKIG